MRETKTILICNLCGYRKEKTGKVDGWVAFTVDHPIEDRSFINVDICIGCRKAFNKALEPEDRQG